MHSGLGEQPAPSTKSAYNSRVESLAASLEGWRKVLIRLDSVLQWEQPALLGGLVAGVTVLFAVVSLLQPPLITFAAIACLLVSACDFLVPHAAQYLLKGEWTQAEEKQFERLCGRLVSAWDRLCGMAEQLVRLRREKPQFYLAITAPALLCLICLGEWFNNLLLCYVATVGCLLLPGLRRSGVPQQLCRDLLALVRSKLHSGAKSQ